MIDINELRRLTQAVSGWDNCNQAWLDQWEDPPAVVVGHIDEDGNTYPVATIYCDQYHAAHQSLPLAKFYAAANPAAISELLDRLEAAESDALEQARLNGMGSEREAALMAKLEAAEKEVEIERMRLAACGVAALGYFEGCAEEYISASLNDVLALRAKIEAMERQDCSKQSMPAEVSREFVMDAIAQALGDAYDCTRVWSAWGYGTMSHDDFQLIAEDGDRLREIADAAIMAMGASASKPCAQPAPSVPDGWLRAIDEALVVANIGVANANDTYEQAKAKLDNLIGFHVDVATDPAVNGGWKPAPSLPERITHDQAPHVYSQEAAEGYADGWNACVKEIVAAAPQNCIKAAMEAQREGCAEIVLQAAHKAADCNNLRDYELLRALSIAVAKAPEAKP